MRVLLVEDDDVVRELITTVLVEERGHDVVAFPTADAAWPSCREAHYEIAVLDWVLPGMNGLELCRRIRTLPDGDTTIVLVCTARTSRADLQAVLDAGANDYIAKPFDVDLLEV